MVFLALLAMASQPAPAAPLPHLPAAPLPPVEAPAQASRFGSLFVDWRATGESALRSEETRARGVIPGEPVPERQARALGEQVGEMVALGDCDGGERLAREAGDLALVGAVQDHCRRQAGGGVLAVSNGPTPESR